MPTREARQTVEVYITIVGGLIVSQLLTYLPPLWCISLWIDCSFGWRVGEGRDSLSHSEVRRLDGFRQSAAGMLAIAGDLGGV